MAAIDDVGRPSGHVPEVDHLDAGCLQNPAHDVDRRIVAIEERGRRDDADGMLSSIGFGRLTAGHLSPCGRKAAHRAGRSRASSARDPSGRYSVGPLKSNRSGAIGRHGRAPGFSPLGCAHEAVDSDERRGTTPTADGASRPRSTPHSARSDDRVDRCRDRARHPSPTTSEQLSQDRPTSTIGPEVSSADGGEPRPPGPGVIATTNRRGSR